MGSDATIHGMIEGCGYGPRPGDRRRFMRHNRTALAQLPHEDPYPPLVRGMFGLTFGPMLTHRAHIIHFGWATKNFAEDWPEWLGKFEVLLRRLVWFSATVHVEGEYDGRLTANFVIHPECITGWQEDPIRLNNTWLTEYDGWMADWTPPT